MIAAPTVRALPHVPSRWCRRRGHRCAGHAQPVPREWSMITGAAWPQQRSKRPSTRACSQACWGGAGRGRGSGAVVRHWRHHDQTSTRTKGRRLRALYPFQVGATLVVVQNSSDSFGSLARARPTRLVALREAGKQLLDGFLVRAHVPGERHDRLLRPWGVLGLFAAEWARPPARNPSGAAASTSAHRAT